jgi:hypothetical protein
MVANPSRILVISLRRIGDLLLTTPLIRSLRRAWPDSDIDVLVFANTAGILAGNPDINRIIRIGRRRQRAHASSYDSGGATISRFRRKAVIAPPFLHLPLAVCAPVWSPTTTQGSGVCSSAPLCIEASRPRTSSIA